MTGPIQEPGPVEKRLVGLFIKTFIYRGRRGKAWRLPPHLDAQPLRFRGNSGARLFGYHIRHAQPRGIVVLAHPDKRYAQHWFVKTGWIDLLQAEGFDALTFDFPVYGQSHGGSTYLYEDVLAAVAEARRLRPGLPIHVIGISIGAFAVANAAPHLDVESLLLESPYPTFTAWYGTDKGSALERGANRLFELLWPKTARRIRAPAQIARAKARRILIAASCADQVTPVPLSRSVALAAPLERTAYLELEGAAHLELFARPAYQAAIRDHLNGRPVRGADLAVLAASPPIEPQAAPLAPLAVR